MTYEEALQWCADNFAVVSFYNVYAEHRVKVKPAGWQSVERYTFIEAVEAAKKLVEEHTRLRAYAEEMRPMMDALYKFNQQENSNNE